ncbi:hypothetical protein [Corynebacterium efficiens YS-314]|uniref:Uncharacterized protein n=1 Tax=Corynebacterium efficiens (strain DSM 44549 / YS-314 / AJ 12310 / JCM 11189 / NBRC 100395) TaxID=196164 RepID=Q8FME7_COREF|nr:hypothetical protein [Corynebacterium efficiens YS-314]
MRNVGNAKSSSPQGTGALTYAGAWWELAQEAEQLGDVVSPVASGLQQTENGTDKTGGGKVGNVGQEVSDAFHYVLLQRLRKSLESQLLGLSPSSKNGD